jgi:hypothetical protein
MRTRTCAQGPGGDSKNPGYTRAQFCTLSAELQLEFDWLDATKVVDRVVYGRDPRGRRQ